MRKFTLVSLAAAVMGLCVANVASAKPVHVRPGAPGSASNPVTIVTLYAGTQETAYNNQLLKGFHKATGYYAKQVPEGSGSTFETVIDTRIAAGDPPMAAEQPRAGYIANLVKQHALQSMASLGLTTAALKKSYAASSLSLTTIKGKVYGFPTDASGKSQIYYSPQSFSKNGFNVPTTWSQLIALAKAMKAKSLVPFAVGANPDSWVLSDWFEEIYLKTYGPVMYDELFSGKISFTSASVIKALNIMDSMLNNNYVLGGIAGAMSTSYSASIPLFFNATPQAEMFFEGTFTAPIAEGVDPSMKPGVNVKAFTFPAINPKWYGAVEASDDFLTVFRNNAATVALAKFMASTAAARLWAESGTIEPNKALPASVFKDPLVRSAFVQLAHAKYTVFDGSDSMPAALGNEWTATLQEVMQNPSQIQSLMQTFQGENKTAYTR